METVTTPVSRGAHNGRTNHAGQCSTSRLWTAQALHE